MSRLVPGILLLLSLSLFLLESSSNPISSSTHTKKRSVPSSFPLRLAPSRSRLGEQSLEGLPLYLEDHEGIMIPKSKEMEMIRTAAQEKVEGLHKRSGLIKRSGESDQVLGARLEKKSVIHGNTLNFYENIFSGSVRGFIWNDQDPNIIFLLVDSTPMLSVNAGQTFDDISSRLEGFTINHNPVFGSGSGGFGARQLYKSTLDRNYVLILGKGSNIWTSTDGGLTFRLLPLAYKGEPLYLRGVSFHPTRRDVLVGTHIDSGCLDGSIKEGDPICSLEVYLSKDFGVTWTLVSTHVWSLFWGSYSAKGVTKDSLYLLVSVDQDSHQLGANQGGLFANPSPLQLVEFTLDDLVTYKIRQDVYQMLSIGEYVYVVARPDGAPNEVDILVSHLGAPFKRTSFEGTVLRGATFLEYSGGSVIMIDTPSWTSESDADFRGDVWTSESTGTYFSRSIRRVILQSTSTGGNYDFHKIESLEGTYIATVSDRQAKLRTKISWNRGGSWQDVVSQAAIDGLVDEDETPFVLYGDIHSASTGTHQGTYSEKSAPGGVLAVGGYGINFADYLTGGVTNGDVYYSRNGGKIFSKILANTHFCRFLDEGSIIVCAPGSTPTSSFLYSLDQGNTWITETFLDHPVDILAIVSDPDSFGLVAIIVGITNNQISLVSVDFAELGLPLCSDADYEQWMPSDGQDERHCIMGHHSTFTRPKAGSKCISNLNQYLVIKGNCACAEEDFECTVGYFYNTTSAYCSPEPGTPVQTINCVNGFYSKNLNYRLIPENTCDKTLQGAIDLEANVQAECPVESLYDENYRKKMLAIGLGLGMSFLAVVIAAAVLFVIWSSKKGYLQYRRVLTNDANGETELEAPDHPEDYDEDNQPHDAEPEHK